ncbi:unnamed protein product [Euphydryas editha]|uniref:Integrase catalytic domain-containing protein n=1 Tax=Euphydryas editha TaxID=104508 RepID=A0AAU9UW11_EUPED|nr:unnamed protein product [Euphydryas editha]
MNKYYSKDRITQVIIEEFHCRFNHGNHETVMNEIRQRIEVLGLRAVHIKLTPSLTTDSMIMALRRFAARREMPKTIYSDNGTNIVGANKELRQALVTLKQ